MSYKIEIVKIHKGKMSQLDWKHIGQKHISPKSETMVDKSEMTVGKSETTVGKSGTMVGKYGTTEHRLG